MGQVLSVCHCNRVVVALTDLDEDALRAALTAAGIYLRKRRRMVTVIALGWARRIIPPLRKINQSYHLRTRHR